MGLLLPLIMIVNMRFGFYMTQKHQYLQDNVVHLKDRYRPVVRGRRFSRRAVCLGRSELLLPQDAGGVLLQGRDQHVHELIEGLWRSDAVAELDAMA